MMEITQKIKVTKELYYSSHLTDINEYTFKKIITQMIGDCDVKIINNITSIKTNKYNPFEEEYKKMVDLFYEGMLNEEEIELFKFLTSLKDEGVILFEVIFKIDKNG